MKTYLTLTKIVLVVAAVALAVHAQAVPSIPSNPPGAAVPDEAGTFCLLTIAVGGLAALRRRGLK